MSHNILDTISKLLNSKTSKFGVAPGTITEPQRQEQALINLIQYSQSDYHQERILSLSDLEKTIKSIPANQVSWLDVDSVSDSKVLETVGGIFDIHPLILEDISNVHQRPKLEDNDKSMYLVLSMIYLDRISKEIIKEQISFVLFKDILISFQEKPGDVFDIVRKRLETAKGRVRKMSADYLLYALVDVILDNYFIVLNHINERINKLSTSIDKNPDNKTIYEVQKLKQKLLNITRYIMPTKEVIWNLMKTESEIINSSTEIYFKDLNDHVLQINDSLDVLRDSLVGLLQYANSMISNKLNEVMKVLTVVSTIFIPLNFIASIYGMNFRNMPELNYQYGYYTVISGMFLIGLFMFAFFRIKKWI